MTQLNLGEYLTTLNTICQNIVIRDQNSATVSLDIAGLQVRDMMLQVLNADQKLLLVGNGGSAAIINHLENDFIKAVGGKALSFTSLSLFSALSNDIGYEQTYPFQVARWAESGDLMVAISSSGRSKNIIESVKIAQTHRCQVVTLSGFGENNPLARLGDLNFYVKSMSYGYVELAHQCLTHYFTDSVLAYQNKI